MRRFVFVVLVAACSRPPPRSDFVLRIAVVGPLQRVHPAVMAGSTTAALDLVYEPLLKPNEAGGLMSTMARSWRRIDSHRYRIALDGRARFSDGSSVTADDVARSLALHGIRVTLAGEWLDLERTGETPIEPVLLFANVFKETPAGPLGTGPFAVVEQDASRIALRRVRPTRGRIARVELVAGPSARDVLSRVIRGDANAALAVDERQLELLEGVPMLHVVRSVSPLSVSVLFNAARFDRETRRQLVAALPLDELEDAACGRRSPARAGAGRLAAMPPGPPLGIVSTIDAGIERGALALRRALGSRAGPIERLDAGAFVDRQRARRFDVALSTLLVWPPMTISLWGLDSLGYSNGAVNAALARGDYAAAQAELERDPPIVNVCRRERIAVFDARIKNPRIGWWGLLDLLPEWEVEP